MENPAENNPLTTLTEGDEFQAIAENSALSSSQMMAALLDATGAKPKEIAKRLGKSELYVYQLRFNNPDYQGVVRQLQGIVAKRIVRQVSDIDELFNSQIYDSVATLVEVRDNPWAKDDSRIKASLAFLDRAPKAPKTQSNQTVNQAIINIPLSSMGAMQAALAEDRGSEGQEILELSRIKQDAEEIGYAIEELEENFEDLDDGEITPKRVEI